MFRFVPRFAAVWVLIVAGTLAPAAAKERPFHASGPGFASGDLLARSFEATHLGHSHLVVGFDQPTFDIDGAFIPSFGIITSASGDELRIVFDEQTYSIDFETNIVSATVTFTGGTGRFQHATGSADVVFAFDPYLYYFTFQIDGSLDY